MNRGRIERQCSVPFIRFDCNESQIGPQTVHRAKKAAMPAADLQNTSAARRDRCERTGSAQTNFPGTNCQQKCLIGMRADFIWVQAAIVRLIEFFQAFSRQIRIKVRGFAFMAPDQPLA